MAQLAVTVSVYLAALAALFVGASFIGAEYSSGALSNWLSFLPERGKVFASKLAALLMGAAMFSAAVSALTLGTTVLVTRATGAKVSDVGPVAALGGRGVGVALIFAVIGFALALVTRHTIAAAGTLVVYLFVSGILTTLVEVIAGLQRLKRLLPQNNLTAFIDYGYTYNDYGGEMTDQGVSETVVQHTISFGHGLIYWVVVVAVLVAGSYVVFRRRDVN
jgi:ABC-2 type transport system permease protein